MLSAVGRALANGDARFALVHTGAAVKSAAASIRSAVPDIRFKVNSILSKVR